MALRGWETPGVPFVTIRPRVALTYEVGGFTFNNNIVMEYNTTNPITGYRSGIDLRDEATLTKTFGRLTLGPAVAYIGQVTNDISSKYYNYAINTNRYTQLAVGGLVGYDFGAVSLSVYGLQNIQASASGGTPLKPGGPDTATTTGGYSVYAQVNFKFPGIGAFGSPIDLSQVSSSPPRHY